MKLNNTVTNNIAKPVAFTSKLGDTTKKVSDHILEKYVEPQRNGTMMRNLFVTTAFVFMLSGRIFNARDKDEKRETLTRDIPTIILAIQGVPLFEKITAKVLQKKSGFAIMSDAEKGSLASADQIKDWYRFDKSLASGFDGFMTRLNDLGGNLKKTTSALSDEIKGKLANFSEDNKSFMDKLSTNEHKGLKQTIIDEFQKEGNAAVKEASFKKSLPKIAGIGATLVLIGICIPKANMALTEHLSKKRKLAEAKTKETQNAAEAQTVAAEPKAQEAAKAEQSSKDIQTANLKTAQNSSSDSTKQAFAQFIN